MPMPPEIRRTVKLGMDNNIHIIVKEGLAKGEMIMLAPTLHKSYIRKQEGPPAEPANVETVHLPSDDPDAKDLDGGDKQSSRNLKSGDSGRGAKLAEKPRRSGR